ncbi:MAG: nickel-dependent lactate racemase [Deltaproteobacteria bacterium]
MSRYFLMGADEKVLFDLPKKWAVLTNAVLEAEEVRQTIPEMVANAIGNPIGTSPLKSLMKPTDRVTVILDDMTRPTPKREILTCLLDHFKAFGVPMDRIQVLIGLGTHRPLGDEEIEKVFGKDICRNIRFTNHDCRSSQLVPVGRLPHAGEVRIHPLVAKADFRMAIGSIIPHPFNGFGGGAKIIFPGVANYEAIRDHHTALMIADGVQLGNLRSNPFHDEVSEAARLAKLDFIVNAVYDSKERVKAIVAGHFEKAYSAGAEMCLHECGVKFNDGADVTLASTFPYTEGPQLMKPLGPATAVTKKGGTVILYASAIRGGRLPEPLLESFDKAFSLCGKDCKQLVLDSLRHKTVIVPDAPMDFNCALDHTLLLMSRINVVLVAKDADEGQAARLGFSFADSLDEAIAKVSKDIPDATVNILPSGGLIIPVVNKEMAFEW